MKMTQRATTAVGLALVATAALGMAPAAAAPANNTLSFDIDCERPDGTTFEGLAVTSNMSQGVTVFVDGRPLVAKALSGLFTGTTTIEGVAEPITFKDEFQQSLGKGVDPTRLAECAFEQTFEQVFTISRRDIKAFNLDPSLLGASASFTGTLADGRAYVLEPTA